MAARWQYILTEALVGLRRNLLMTVAVILSVAVSLTLLGASLLLREQVKLATDDWTGKIEVSIFLCDGSTCPAIGPEQRDDLETALEQEPVVDSVFYESKEDAYERFKDRFKDQPELVDTISSDALPASFRVKLGDPEQFAVIRDRFGAWPGVEEIIDQREILADFFTVTSVFEYSAIGIALIQLIAAMVLITNTIRVAAFARRDQTSIMKLVGASNWYIRLPFVLEGVLAGLTGALVSWLLLLAFVPQATGLLRDRISLTPFIGVQEVLLVGPKMLLVGVAIAAISSVVALRRFLDV